MRKTRCQRTLQKSTAGEIKDFTGISSPFEIPKILILVKTDEQTPDESIDYLFEQLKSKL